MTNLIEFLTLEIKVFLISMLPVVELRGAIPYGVAMGMSPFQRLYWQPLAPLFPLPLFCS